MGISKESAARILEAGGSLKVQNMSKDSLVELAAIARRRGVRLEIKGALSADSMVEIAKVGGQNVLFDVAD